LRFSSRPEPSRPCCPPALKPGIKLLTALEEIRGAFSDRAWYCSDGEEMLLEKRHHRRYLVPGHAVAQTAAEKTSSDKFTGEIVSVGGGGLLMLTDVSPPAGADLEVRFTIQGYRSEITAQMRVVRTDQGFIGTIFLEEPPGLAELLLWLESEFVMGFTGSKS
jgi:hypothetical protein